MESSDSGPLPPWQPLIEQLTNVLQRLERENALLRGGGQPNPLDKEIEDIMGKVDNFTELGMAKLGAAPVTLGRGQPTLQKKTAEPFQRELTLPTLQGDSSEPASSIVSQAESPRSPYITALVRLELEFAQTKGAGKDILAKGKTKDGGEQALKASPVGTKPSVQTVNPTQPSAVKPWYVINPARCPMGGAWQILVCMSLIFVALVTPVQVCLLQVKYNSTFFLSLLVDFIFFIDMILQFCTAYTRNTPSGVVLEVRLHKIVARYVKTWFVLDFVTLIPFDAFAPVEADNEIAGYSSVKVLRALRLLKLIRLARRSLWMEEQEALRSIPYQQLALGRFLLVLGLMCHWLACVWALTLQLVDDKYPQWIDDIQESDLEYFGVQTRDSPYRVYVASFFFCACTAGHSHWVVGSVIVLISGLAWAYIIGEVGAIVDDLTHESQEFRQRMHRLNTMMGDQGLEPDLQCRLRRYFLQNRHQSVFKERQALMERSLRGSFLQAVHQSARRTEKVLELYTDASHSPGGDRSMQSVFVLWHRVPIAWEASRQPFTTLSSAESELVCMVHGIQLAEAVQPLVDELIEDDSVTALLADNEAAIRSFESTSSGWRNQHLMMRAVAGRERVEAGMLKVSHLPGDFQVADLGTKP
ncbi:Potassium voltage-gated channel subfamily H member 6 [Symbiodinium microadriaticum]|uniref:Potassium voltage-gated channel subfamily H member 6 n=1 Tax=Symbiodinium microadriaticum TaxID=2951 RepID=A0A1Q9ETR3_SYMMI|nr:Potassium voltage-gated channel subfamily H member 6 [Symbiodinium microadriaticum]